MIFVLDTNSLHTSSWTLNSPHLETLIGTAERLGNTVVLPRVVVEEAIKHYSEELEELREIVNSRLSKYRKMSARLGPEGIGLEQFCEDLAGHRARIEALFSKSRAWIAAHPSVSHTVIIDTYAAGKKPFKTDGAGYKDLLIWHTVLELCESYPDDTIVLVTNNTTDFCASSSEKQRLHPDLVETLEDRAVIPSRVLIVNNLYDCIREHVTPRVEAVGEVARDILEGRRFDVNEQFKSVIDSAFLDESVEGFTQYEPRVFWSLADFWWAQYQEDTTVNSIEGMEVIHISGGRYQVSASVSFSGAFEVEADLYSDATDWFDLMPDFEQRSASGSVTATFRANVSFIWDDEEEWPSNGVVENLDFLEFAYPEAPDGD